MGAFLHSVSSEFCSSLRTLLTAMHREGRQGDSSASASDVTLPELEGSSKERETMDQLRERNAFLVNACRELKARMREERREGKRVRKENTSLSLEREGLLAKMSETEKEIIEKISEHTALMELYSQLQQRVKERERNARDAHSQIAAMEVEVSKMNSLLSKVEKELSESRQREEEKQRENSHLYEQLAVKEKEKEVMELKSAAERVQSHARLLSAMEETAPSPPLSPHAYTVGLVSTDRILEEATSLCDQLSQLTELFTAGPSHSLARIRTGLSHALEDGTTLLRDVSALKIEHERCKDALFQLQMEERGYDVPSDPIGGVDLLSRIAEIAPRIKLEAEVLAEQWDGREQTEVSDAASNTAMLLRAILVKHMGEEVPQSLVASLSSLLSPRERGGSTPSPDGADAGLGGMLQESSLLLNSMSEALTGEQLKRRSQVRALRKQTQRDCSVLRRVQLECEGARREEQLVKQALSSLLDNLCQAEECEVRLTQGVREESVRQVAERTERLLLAGYNEKIAALKERLVSTLKNWEQTRKVLEGALCENESLSHEVRELSLCRVKLEGESRQMESEVDRLCQLLREEREESEGREGLLATKLSIVQEHIEQYDRVMFLELDKLSEQLRSDTTERDEQQRREEDSQEVVRGLRQQLTAQGDHVEYLERELTIYQMKLLDHESRLKQIDALSSCTEETKVEKKKEVHFSQDLPEPTPYSLPPVAPLRGEELHAALGVALSQEKLFARAHLSLQTERDRLGEENKQLRDRLNSLHQRISDPLGLIPSRPASSPVPTPPQGPSPAEKRLELEKASLAAQLVELNGRLGRLESRRSLHADYRNRVKSLLWQKSYLKSQLDVYFSSLRASALILADLGVGVDKIGARSSTSGRSKFRVFVWVVIFICRLSHCQQTQPNLNFLDYTPPTGQSPFSTF